MCIKKMRFLGLLTMFLCSWLCACKADNPNHVVMKDIPMVSDAEKLIWLGEERNDGWRCEGVCIGSDGMSCDSFLVRILSEEGDLFQEIPLYAESRIMPTGATHWEDVNFDGELDVLVHLGGGRGGAQGYAAVLWDEAIQGYREESGYAKIGSPAPDSEHRIIWDGLDTGFQFDLSAWEYIDGALAKTHQLSALYDSGPQSLCVSLTEYAVESGILMEIQKIVMAQDVLLAVDSYISEHAIWEGWTWCNVQHFQQKG